MSASAAARGRAPQDLHLERWTFHGPRPEREFSPRVPGIPGDGSPVVLHVDAERGLTFTWHDISRRDHDWCSLERGYLVSRLTVTDVTGAEVGGINATHTTPELIAEVFPTPFHWADENTGTGFGFRWASMVTPQHLWASAYSALRARPESTAGSWSWGLGESDAPDDPAVLVAELEHAQDLLAARVAQFVEFLSVPLVDYSHLDETYTTLDGRKAPLRGTGVGRTMYLLAARRLATQGKVLRASGTQSHLARALWKRLVEDPTVPTRKVTVTSWTNGDPRTYTCLDYADEVPHISAP